MVARRLVAVLLVMLFISSLAAVLAPVDPETDRSTSATQAEQEPATERPRGELIRQSVDAGGTTPQVVEASIGDQLQLRVTSERQATLVIAGIGASEDVGPDAPAFFDVLLRRGGEFPVRELKSGREVATIEVDPAPLPGPDPAT
ncbi:hypothetical protein BH24ACT23_BH24ACT23_08760 [soil metagenome]